MKVNNTNKVECRDDSRDIGTQFYKEYKKIVKKG